MIKRKQFLMLNEILEFKVKQYKKLFVKEYSARLLTNKEMLKQWKEAYDNCKKY